MTQRTTSPQFDSGKVNPTAIAADLEGIDFPANKMQIVEQARRNEREREQIVQVLDRLPDKQYSSMADVEKEVGKIQ